MPCSFFPDFVDCKHETLNFLEFANLAFVQGIFIAKLYLKVPTELTCLPQLVIDEAWYNSVVHVGRCDGDDA